MADPPSTKLIVLGLPWAANEDSLWAHFSQFGNIRSVEIIRDKQSGKSRGFGFINFDEGSAAEQALSAAHNIGGRRCDVKPAVPKGDRFVVKTRRIFVARIPSNVTEREFQEHFAVYGRMEDAYMPKDHTRRNHRGIGFVTYADPSSVDRVMAEKHMLGDVDVVVDCANPKEAQGQETGVQGAWQDRPHGRGHHHTSSLALPSDGSPVQQRQLGTQSASLCADSSVLQTAQFEKQLRLFQVLREQRQYMAASQIQESSMDIDQAQVSMLGSLLPSNLLPDGLVERQSSDLASAMSSLSHDFDVLSHLPQGMPVYSGALSPRDPGPWEIDQVSSFVGVSMSSNVLPVPSQPLNARRPQSVHSVNSSQGADSSRVITVRNGPRIFVGKLSRETCEQDLRDHFTKFGYVMDVFMPRARDNKKEHRGFGFITFETGAAIQRVVAHGVHKIKDSVIAIDVAVPEEPSSVAESQGQRFDLASGGDSSMPSEGEKVIRSDVGGSAYHMQGSFQ